MLFCMYVFRNTIKSDMHINLFLNDGNINAIISPGEVAAHYFCTIWCEAKRGCANDLTVSLSLLSSGAKKPFAARGFQWNSSWHIHAFQSLEHCIHVSVFTWATLCICFIGCVWRLKIEYSRVASVSSTMCIYR